MPDPLLILLFLIYLWPLLVEVALWALPPALLLIAAIHWGPAVARRAILSAKRG